MKRIVSVLTVAAIVVAMLAASAGNAFAFAGNPNGADAPGQAKAVENCFETIARQDAKGVTGTTTGSPKDEKLLPTAVTNCDHFWQAAGSNP